MGAIFPIFVGEAGFPRFLQVGLSAEAVHGFRNCDLDRVCAAAVVGVNAVKDFLELKKKKFRRSASATLLCVYVERRKVSRRGTSGPSRGNGRQTRPLSVPREVSLFFLLGPQQPTRRESPQAREPSSASPPSRHDGQRRRTMRMRVVEALAFAKTGENEALK